MSDVLRHIASTYAYNSGASTLAMTLPAGTGDGDLIFMQRRFSPGYGDQPLPSGDWTRIDRVDAPSASHFNSATCVDLYWAWYHESLVIDCPALTSTSPVAIQDAMLHTFRGADPETPFDVAHTTGNTGGLSAHAPSITTDTDQCLVVGFLSYSDEWRSNAYDEDDTPLKDFGQFQFASQGISLQDACIQAFGGYMQTAGATGTFGRQLSQGLNHGAITVALRPAPGVAMRMDRVTCIGRGTPSASTGTATPAVPAGAATGDLLILVMEYFENVVANPPPGGDWTLVGSGHTSQTSLAVYWAWYDPSINLTVPDPGNHILAAVYGYRGVDPTDPIDGTPVGDGNDTVIRDWTIASGYSTVTERARVLFAAGMQDDTGTWMGGSGFGFGPNNNDIVFIGRRDPDFRSGVGNDGGLGILEGWKWDPGDAGTYRHHIAGFSERTAWVTFGLKPEWVDPLEPPFPAGVPIDYEVVFDVDMDGFPLIHLYGAMDPIDFVVEGPGQQSIGPGIEHSIEWATDGYNGLIDWLGKDKATTTFANPVSRGYVTATQSSTHAGLGADLAFDQNYGTSNRTHTTNATHLAWWQADFGEGKGVALRRFGIDGQEWPHNHPRNFNIEGSDDGSSWTVLYAATAEGPNLYTWWSTAIVGASPYRYIRIIGNASPLDSSGNNYLILGDVEMWGDYHSDSVPGGTDMDGLKGGRGSVAFGVEIDGHNLSSGRTSSGTIDLDTELDVGIVGSKAAFGELAIIMESFVVAFAEAWWDLDAPDGLGETYDTTQRGRP